MSRIILQMDERGRITIPQSLRQAWRLRPGDYLVIDPDRRRIDRAEILTDEELSDPRVVKALRKLKAEAEKDLYAGRTKRLDSYVAEGKPEDDAVKRVEYANVNLNLIHLIDRK